MYIFLVFYSYIIIVLILLLLLLLYSIICNIFVDLTTRSFVICIQNTSPETCHEIRCLALSAVYAPCYFIWCERRKTLRSVMEVDRRRRQI